MRSRTIVTTLLAAASMFVATPLVTGAVAQAEAAAATDALSHVTLSATAFAPGAHVDVTWQVDPRYTGRIKTIEIWLGHSTGMGHGFNTRVAAGVDARRDLDRFTVPQVAPSSHHDIWSVDLVWDDNGTKTELSTTPVTITPAPTVS